MTRRGTTVLLLLAAGCSSARPAPAPAVAATREAAVGLVRATAAGLVAEYASHHVAALSRRQFAPERYWETLLPIVEAGGERFSVTKIGRSVEGRPLRRVDFGQGDTIVLMWSQMHGNESTASRALVDIFNYLASAPDDPLVRRIEGALHVVAVPMLNPDGAARFVRHNALGIDINRDARRLSTPEARALKALRDETNAPWGFNLHDQNVRTRLGSSGRDVLIALLAPPPGFGETSPQNQAAKQMCSLLVGALESVVGDQVARYDESFNPRAFGDLMTRWGTGVVLIESGGELSDPDKAKLRLANYVAVLTALDAIARGSWEAYAPSRYLNLPLNSPWVYDLVVRGGSIVLPGAEPIRADFAVNYGDTLDRTGGTVVEVGDLEGTAALEEIDASDLYFVPDPDFLTDDAGRYLRIGDAAVGVLARDPEGRDIVRRLGDPGESRRQ